MELKKQLWEDVLEYRRQGIMPTLTVEVVVRESSQIMLFFPETIFSFFSLNNRKFSKCV